jgi:hypothetical protein
MPIVMDAHKLMEEMWSRFCVVEAGIMDTLKCDHRDWLPDLQGCSAPYGDRDAVSWVDRKTSVVCTPILQFHTKEQLEGMLGGMSVGLLCKLQQQKPKSVGNMWVACSVNPGRMCYELTLAIPFSKEE